MCADPRKGAELPVEEVSPKNTLWRERLRVAASILAGWVCGEVVT
jgi:hypothetical protein